MPILGFDERFAALVESGEKTQTIRKPRAQPIRRGDRLYFYTGPYRKGERLKIGEGRCTRVRLIRFQNVMGRRVCFVGNRGRAQRRYRQTQHGADKFAQADGFRSFDEMVGYIEGAYGLPFEGSLIEWELTDGV